MRGPHGKETAPRFRKKTFFLGHIQTISILLSFAPLRAATTCRAGWGFAEVVFHQDFEQAGQSMEGV